MAASTRRILHGVVAGNISPDEPDGPGPGGPIPSEFADGVADARRPPPTLRGRFDDGARGSMLSRFLLATDERGDGDGRKSCWSRLRGCPARPGSMDSMDACWCSLMLEPTKSRSARVVMLGEAYALFGALFLNCTWSESPLDPCGVRDLLSCKLTPARSKT